MKIRNLRYFVLGAIAFFSLSTQQSYALLAGVKTTGMAATSVSYPIDSFAGAYNPAGISLLNDRIDLGLSWVHYTQKLNVHDNASVLNLLNPDNPLNGRRNAAKTPSVYVPEFGMVKHFCFNLCDCPIDITAGLVCYNRNYLKTTYGRPIPLLGTTRVGLEFLHQTIAPMFAIRLWDIHSLGLSINVNVQRIKVNGLENFANAQFSSDPTNATNQNYNWSTGCGVTLGYLCQPIDSFRIGLSWTPKTSMPRFKKYQGFIADKGNFPTPMRFQAGASYDVFCGFTVAFDYEFVRWKDIQHLKNPFVPNLFVPGNLGTKNGAGFGWNNQHYYRVGTQYSLNECWDFRLGYRYATCPIGRSVTAVNLLTMDTVQSVITAGTTFHLNCAHEFSVLYAYGFNHKVKGNNSIPLVQPFGGGEADLEQSLFVLGVTWGWQF